MKKNILLLLMMILSGCSLFNSTNSGFKSITMDEAKTIIENESDYILLDVRREDEYSNGHIEGAINIPNEIIGSEEILELPNKDQRILVYCRSGIRAKDAASKLVVLGYTNIIDIGGILDWTGDIVK